MKNKKKVVSVLFLLSAFFMLISAVYAQEIKFMLGGNLSKYRISPAVYYHSVLGDGYTYEISSKKGFLLGVGIEFNLGRNISFEIDALYLQKCTKAHLSYSRLEIYVAPKKYTLHVISIPVLLKIKFLQGTSPYILGGHELSLILSHGSKSSLDGETEDFISRKEDTTTFESSLVFGVGLEMKVKAASFFIEGRYHYGLNNIIKGHIDWESTKTRAVVLILGLKIKFQK
ncbi:MAG: PorT family protein [Candidatus Aminicenantes bacterium]|nr:PorT family protein [Candidatus Aminicenantes bacterium]